MKYSAMAKHWIYEQARNHIPTHEDGEGLAVGRSFTDGELGQFSKAVETELERMEKKLRDKNIIL